MDNRLQMISARCCNCDDGSASAIGSGEDFEYHTSADTFHAWRCDTCGLVFLNPRPSSDEFSTIYPPDYHAFDFSESDFGLVYKIRSRLEASRILRWCRELPDDAKIIDIGCGDGFHLELLRKHGRKGWNLEGIDLDPRAAQSAVNRGFKVSCGSIEQLDLPENTYDLAVMIMTIEHLAEPAAGLESVLRILKPGGKLVIVTDNTDSLDFSLFKGRHWGGYHFPRHWNLFNRESLRALAERTGFQTVKIATQVSPVNWVYSIHNRLVDRRSPRWLIDRFTLRSKASLGVFTLLDIVLRWFGRGALLSATIRKPS